MDAEKLRFLDESGFWCRAAPGALARTSEKPSNAPLHRIGAATDSQIPSKLRRLA